MTNAQVYSHPDIRKQTLEQAEAFITAKRARRMVLLHDAKAKQSIALAKLHGAELEKFNKQAVRVENALKKVEEAINAAAQQIRKLHETSHSLSNTETRMKEL